MAEQKQYVGQWKATEYTTRDGSKARFLKLSLSPIDLERINAYAATNSGWCNIDISKRKEIGKYGETHSGYINTWKPTPKQPDISAGEAHSSEIPDDGVVVPF